MMLRAVSLLAVLSACSAIIKVPDIPLVHIAREPDGTETVFTGFIKPKMDFSSTFSTRSNSGIECQGQSSNKGAMTMSCTNGWRASITVPKGVYGKPDGRYADVANGTGVAVGWGDGADVALLRSLFE